METTKNLTPDLFEPAETDVKEQEQIARKKLTFWGMSGAGFVPIKER